MAKYVTSMVAGNVHVIANWLYVWGRRRHQLQPGMALLPCNLGSSQR